MDLSLTQQSVCRILVDPPGDPEGNMAADERISLLAMEENRPILRIYRWDRPAISLGRRQPRQPAEQLPPNSLPQGVPVVHRPTGGGAVFHFPEELTYALAVPRASLPVGMDLKRIPGFLHRQLAAELEQRGAVGAGDLTIVESDRVRGPAAFCFSAPVCGDLMYRGRKAGGAALRVWRAVVLVQGTLQRLPVSIDWLQDALAKTAGGLFALIKPQDPTTAGFTQGPTEEKPPGRKQQRRKNGKDSKLFP